MARIDPDQRDRQRQKRKVIVLAVLGVVALGLVVKRAIPPASVAAHPPAPKAASTDSKRMPLVLLMPAPGVELLSATASDPFAALASEPSAPTSGAVQGFSIDGLLRGRVSFAMINGVRRKEGERFDGVLLKRVDADGVVLEIDGQERFIEIVR